MICEDCAYYMKSPRTGKWGCTTSPWIPDSLTECHGFVRFNDGYMTEYGIGEDGRVVTMQESEEKRRCRHYLHYGKEIEEE